MRVLIAEDEKINQIYMSHLLRNAGHEVVVASNGREALARLEEQGFDVVLMDVQMPELDGLEACRRIREGRAGEGTRDVPVIALTAYATPNDNPAHRDAGVTASVTKPTDERKLLALIHELAGSEDQS